MLAAAKLSTVFKRFPHATLSSQAKATHRPRPRPLHRCSTLTIDLDRLRIRCEKREASHCTPYRDADQGRFAARAIVTGRSLSRFAGVPTKWGEARGFVATDMLGISPVERP